MEVLSWRYLVECSLLKKMQFTGIFIVASTVLSFRDKGWRLQLHSFGPLFLSATGVNKKPVESYLTGIASPPCGWDALIAPFWPNLE